MTNKQIVEAQKLLRLFEKTPVKVYNNHGDVYWQVVYDNETYNSLMNVVESVAKMPIRDYYSNIIPEDESAYTQPVAYHRDKI